MLQHVLQSTDLWWTLLLRGCLGLPFARACPSLGLPACFFSLPCCLQALLACLFFTHGTRFSTAICSWLLMVRLRHGRSLRSISYVHCCSVAIRHCCTLQQQTFCDLLVHRQQYKEPGTSGTCTLLGSKATRPATCESFWCILDQLQWESQGISRVCICVLQHTQEFVL